MIDGASFYEIATTSKTALEDLFDVLPIVISDLTLTPAMNIQQIKTLFKMAYG